MSNAPTSSGAAAAPAPKQPLNLRRVVMIIAFLIPCIVIEAGVMISCYIMLKQVTNPATAIIGGLGMVAVVLMAVELLKIPFAVASAAAPQRSIRWIAFGLFGIVSISTAETLMTGISKNYEISQEPAVRAIEQIDDGERRIADAENAIAQITDVSLRVEEMVADRRSEAQTELDRIAAERAARMAEFDARVAEVRGGPGLQPLERDRLTAIEQTIRDRREQMRQAGPNAARIATIGEERAAILASRAEAGRELNALLAAIGGREQTELARVSDAARERRAAAGGDRNAEVARIDEAIEVARAARAEVITNRDAEIAEHRRNDKPFYNLDSKITAANKRAGEEIGRIDAQLADLREQRKAFLGSDDPRVAVDAWLAGETAAIRERHEAERREARTTTEGALSSIADRLEALQSEETRLLAADAAAIEDRARRFEVEIAAAETEAAELRAAAAARMSAASDQVQAALAEIEAERQEVAGGLDDAAATVVATRDERIAALESRAMTAEQAAVRRGELEATIAAARQQITEASLTRDRSRKDSILYNLARIISETDDPTPAEVQWTLKWMIPIAAFIIAIVPAVGVKLSIHAVLADPTDTGKTAIRRRRRRSRSERRSLLEKVAAHELKRREAAEREAAVATEDAERATREAAELKQQANRLSRQTDDMLKENLKLRDDLTNFVREHPQVVEYVIRNVDENGHAPSTHRTDGLSRADVE